MDDGLLRPAIAALRPGWVPCGSSVQTAAPSSMPPSACFLNQWAYSVQQAFAQTLPFFYAEDGERRRDAMRPTYQRKTCCSRQATARSAAPKKIIKRGKMEKPPPENTPFPDRR